MASRKIQATKNYRMFTRSEDNRPTDMARHKRLFESMKEYGFLPCFPIVCRRDGNGDLIVKDGQHRLMIAESLGIAVHWVEEEIDFNIATINTTSRVWGLVDYAKMFAKKGLGAYQECMDFSDSNKLPLGTAVALLGGTTNWGNIKNEFLSGRFKIKDRAWAEAVAGIYVPFAELSKDVSNARFLEACMAVCRVKEFDAGRLLHSGKRCREKLVSYSTREAYLEMLDDIYNFGRQKLFALKTAALIAMRERNAVVSKKNAKSDRVAHAAGSLA